MLSAGMRGATAAVVDQIQREQVTVDLLLLFFKFCFYSFHFDFSNSVLAQSYAIFFFWNQLLLDPVQAQGHTQKQCFCFLLSAGSDILPYLILDVKRCHLRYPGIALRHFSQGGVATLIFWLSQVLNASSDSVLTIQLANPFHSGLVVQNFCKLHFHYLVLFWKDLLSFVKYCSTMSFVKQLLNSFCLT